MNDIKLLNIGTIVKFGEDNKIKGKISAITIRKNSVHYEISYWKLDESKTIWLNQEDLKIAKVEKLTIGFIDEKTA